MSIVTWLRTPRIRRGLAATVVVLAAGGLILFRAPAGATPNPIGGTVHTPLGQGTNLIQFSGPGAHGQVALSQSRVFAGAPTQIFAEIRMIADASEQHARAPLSMAIVLDTSGSMEGEKIDRAKESVIRLIRDMRDDDEVAFIRYADDASVVQGLARVGSIRESLIARVRDISAGGGTAIPRGLAAALTQINGASSGRVRRVVLASDGLDSTRQEAERLAMTSAERGITVSSMGIGLDFDESYMGGVARAGHGNFAFVKDGAALASFLQRELVETATTTIENATVHLNVPPGMRFVRATGADLSSDSRSTDSLDLRIGSLFAGDERRVVIEFESTMGAGDERDFSGQATWTRVGGGSANAPIGKLALRGTTDRAEATASKDTNVLATATSVSASALQLEAAQAYEQGDTARAQALVDKSVGDLEAAAALAPAPAASALAKQSAVYRERKPALARPATEAGNVAAKKGFQEDNDNLGRVKTW